MSASLRVIEEIAALRQQVRAWRGGGQRIAFVPTMGNLHDGHLTLVRAARADGVRLVVSIFVNPLQFGPREDLATYPRTPEEDRERLAAAGVDVLFTPSAAAIYPRGLAEQTRVEVPGLSGILCGASRPGHFTGVATVVCKLFNIVQPDLAYFGEKDFQQLLVIGRMVEDLGLPIEIVGVPTVREPDGLAMSSRNGYLTPSERGLAPALYHALERAGAALRAGEAVAEVERSGRAGLDAAGLRPDYFAVRRAGDLGRPEPADRDLVVLAAVFLGTTRLIDNLRVRRGGSRDRLD
ncbi:pantoate--beta-alanine ligase [Thiococcus pfennigii]|uniref:pantoate--beta-alanine ligase n=1 Tax=Thiococcus pfennigii TaxID=1057 RepID=UPI001F5B6906|nr:pantoate--beta-alanine ligase [Thiococcus pfennigii]MBK1731685.1 pantoate--beta-alanine ligase [Thiococcus pfennigii]